MCFLVQGRELDDSATLWLTVPINYTLVTNEMQIFENRMITLIR